MNRIFNYKTFIAALFSIISVLGTTNADALEKSFNVVLIGNFIPIDEKGNTRTFVLRVDEKEWNFKVTKPQISGPRGSVSGWQVLRKIIPRKLMLVGNEKVIQFLSQSQVVGKSFKLKGFLYVNSKKLFIRSAEEILEKDTHPEDE